MKNKMQLSVTRKISYTGMLFALACVLSLVEGALALPMLMPGIKIGLANIVVMYAAFYLGKGQAVSLVLLKALFNLTTRGVVAGATSLVGGGTSLFMIIIITYVTNYKASYYFLSIVGAVFHNLGQLLVARIILKNAVTWLYLPVLLISGICMGIFTGFTLKVVTPYLKQLGLTKALNDSKKQNKTVD